MIKKSQIASLLREELDKTKPDAITDADLEKFLSQYSGKDKIVTSEEILEEIKRHGIRKGMSTGIGDMDVITGGFYEEQVIVITAYPKSGKTSFCLWLADNMKEQNPLFLAIEQSPHELIEQLVERNMSVPHFYAPEFIDGFEKTVDWIHLKILESQFKSASASGRPTKVVLVDHFGYIQRSRDSDHVTYDIIKTMQDLKSVAKQTKTCIVIIVHTTKADETEPPTTKDLFGSAGYHQEADIVLSLWREAFKDDKKITKTNNVLLQVLANRKRGDTGAIKFTFENGKFNRNDWANTNPDDKELDSYTKALK